MLVLKALDRTGTERTLDTDKPFSMGRGPDNDWVLVDPAREISKIHCRIEPEETGFTLVDLSINGVLIEGRAAPMGPGGRHRLASGDVFRVGQHRFLASVDGDPVDVPVGDLPPADVGHILAGRSEGSEARGSTGVSDDAARWLGDLPIGTVDETLRLPMGWNEPPPTQAQPIQTISDDLASDFANRSEHAGALNNVVRMPQAQQLLPNDWLQQDELLPSKMRKEDPLAGPLGTRQNASSPEARQQLAEGGRLDVSGLKDLPDDELFRRCGEALRAMLDGLDLIEAAQAVAERDCHVQATVPQGLWTDFFANHRDPLLALLSDPQAAPGAIVARRFADLADRQRALGAAVAAAAIAYDAELAPEPIAAQAKHRFGLFSKADAWMRFAARHAELAAKTEGAPTFMALLRKAFSRVSSNHP